MKRASTILAMILGSQVVSAADLYCGANVEQVPGSQVYNKLVFWEKIDTTKPTSHYLLADGTLIKASELTPESLAKIIDGTLALSISFIEGRPQLFLGKVKRNESGEVKFTDIAMASSFNGNSHLLVANGAALLCKEF